MTSAQNTQVMDHHYCGNGGCPGCVPKFGRRPVFAPGSPIETQTSHQACDECESCVDRAIDLAAVTGSVAATVSDGEHVATIRRNPVTDPRAAAVLAFEDDPIELVAQSAVNALRDLATLSGCSLIDAAQAILDQIEGGAFQ